MAIPRDKAIQMVRSAHTQAAQGGGSGRVRVVVGRSR